MPVYISIHIVVSVEKFSIILPSMEQWSISCGNITTSQNTLVVVKHQCHNSTSMSGPDLSSHILISLWIEITMHYMSDNV